MVQQVAYAAAPPQRVPEKRKPSIALIVVGAVILLAGAGALYGAADNIRNHMATSDLALLSGATLMPVLGAALVALGLRKGGALVGVAAAGVLLITGYVAFSSYSFGVHIDAVQAQVATACGSKGSIAKCFRESDDFAKEFGWMPNDLNEAINRTCSTYKKSAEEKLLVEDECKAVCKEVKDKSGSAWESEQKSCKSVSLYVY